MIEYYPPFVLAFLVGMVILFLGTLRNIFPWLMSRNLKASIKGALSIIFSKDIYLVVKGFVVNVFLKSRLRKESRLRGWWKALFVTCYVLIILFYEVKGHLMHQLESLGIFEHILWAPFLDIIFLRDATPATFGALDAFFGFTNDLFAAVILSYEFFSIYRRFIKKESPIKTTIEDVVSDISMASWMGLRYFAEIATIVAYSVPPSIAQYWFVSYGISQLIGSAALPWLEISYALWVIAGVFLGLLVALIPFTKLWHIVMGPVVLTKNYVLEAKGMAIPQEITRKEKAPSLRPIGWGLLGSIGSGIVWLTLSLAVESQRLAGQPATALPLVLLSSYVFFFSLPVAIVAEIAIWWSRRHEKKV